MNWNERDGRCQWKEKKRDEKREERQLLILVLGG